MKKIILLIVAIVGFAFIGKTQATYVFQLSEGEMHFSSWDGEEQIIEVQSYYYIPSTWWVRYEVPWSIDPTKWSPYLELTKLDNSRLKVKTIMPPGGHAWDQSFVVTQEGTGIRDVILVHVMPHP